MTSARTISLVVNINAKFNLHINQRTVLWQPGFLQNFKNSLCGMTHDVHFSLPYNKASKTQFYSNELLLRTLWIIIGIILEEHLHFGWIELVPLLYTRVPFEERPSCYSSAHPLNGDHFTLGCNESSLPAFLGESSFYTCKLTIKKGGKQ